MRRKKMVRRTVVLISLMLMMLLLSGCSRVMDLKRQGFYLDNVVEVKLKYKKERDLKERRETALANAFNGLVQLDTNLNKLSTVSELVALNTMAGMRNVEVTPETYNLIKKSIAASIITDGYFDVTWEPLVKIFENGRQPSQGEIRAASAAAGYLNIQLDRGLNRIKFSNSGTKISFDRIKRGFAIDNVVQALAKRNLRSGYVKTGNLAYYFGNKKEKVKMPNRRDMKFNVSNKAIIVLSADDDYLRGSAAWRSYLPVDVSPNTIEKVVVVAPNALTAEVLANAFFFMGPERSLQLVDGLKQKANDRNLYNAVIVTSENGSYKIYSSLKRKRKS